MSLFYIQEYICKYTEELLSDLRNTMYIHKGIMDKSLDYQGVHISGCPFSKGCICICNAFVYVYVYVHVQVYACTCTAVAVMFNRILKCILHCTTLQMDWCSLREVFPMLNSAQLHYLLEHYKLSVSRPDHWTPSDGDEEEAYNLGISDCVVYSGVSYCGYQYYP